VAFAGALVGLWLARAAGATTSEQSALAFLSLVAGNLALLLTTRDFSAPWWVTVRRRNPAVPVLLTSGTALLLLVLGTAPLRELFRFEAPAPENLARSLLWTLLPVLCLDALKALRSGKRLADRGAGLS
jgi:Ca2+-transporting ATPase